MSNKVKKFSSQETHLEYDPRYDTISVELYGNTLGSLSMAEAQRLHKWLDTILTEKTREAVRWLNNKVKEG